MSKNQRNGRFLRGLLAGAVLGTATGLLLAPRSGKETRRLLKKSTEALPDLVEDLTVSLQLQADRLSTAALTRWQGTLARLQEAMVAGVEASQQEFLRNQNAERNVTAAGRELQQTIESLPVRDNDS